MNKLDAHKMNSTLPIPSKQSEEKEQSVDREETTRRDRNISAEPSLQIRNRNDVTKISDQAYEGTKIKGVVTKAESRNMVEPNESKLTNDIL